MELAMPRPMLSKIPNMADRELLVLFKNAHKVLEKNGSTNKDQASEIITAIEGEWEDRVARAEGGTYQPELPDIGMLKTLGYSVGNSGEKLKIRRQILRTLMVSVLPVVGSPAYTASWGSPNSVKRYKKLETTLNSFIANADPGWEKAILEWREDLDYIQKLK